MDLLFGSSPEAKKSESDDDLFSSHSTSKSLPAPPKTKPAVPKSTEAKKSESDDDLFSSHSTSKSGPAPPKTKPAVPKSTEAKKSESDDDLFSSHSTSKSGPAPPKSKPAVPKSTEAKISESDDDLFSSNSTSKSGPAPPKTKPAVPKAKKSESDDDLFSSNSTSKSAPAKSNVKSSVPVTKPHPSPPAVTGKANGELFNDINKDDLFSGPKSDNSETSRQDLSEVVAPRKKPVGGVSIFGGMDPFGTKVDKVKSPGHKETFASSSISKKQEELFSKCSSLFNWLYHLH